MRRGAGGLGHRMRELGGLAQQGLGAPVRHIARSVNAARRLSRSTSFTPSAASSRRPAWDTKDWVRPSRLAATVMLRDVATSTKMRVAS